ncbi:P1 family peptidase [Fimbriimonas ginsengisoli]|uniref:Putative peptidase family T4 n=1 Tax=Fimbriimonas ginsengisoli Gsoil 348 TaxID=661478 RepID=A0A068NXU4_FIMGI|nr:P1 family peptidase [Fimbriimonas ginsengisoli]AIE86469.1 putative peptidase family T4 [Fimbriimonas ginsengisoli Gsoil 348]
MDLTRARELGIPFAGTPGTWNSITDVAGVEVGHCTLDPLDGSVRTGVTAILPRGLGSTAPTFAGSYALNGNGEMTGTAWIEEAGFLDSPILLTNTHSVGVVRDAVIAWQVKRDKGPSLNRQGDSFWSLPVVAETYDGFLNDINGFHVRPENVFAALDGACSGPVPEGNVGGGTGMVCFQFKGGIGTSSRRVGDYTVGVLVQANMGARRQMTIAGVPLGLALTEDMPALGPHGDVGSIIVVIATDAPLLPHQLKRIARRGPMGLARTGSTANNSSGDLFIAFSVAPAGSGCEEVLDVQMLANDAMSPLFEATVQAVEEAIVNALVAAETMTGLRGNTVSALAHGSLQALFARD